MTDARVVVTRHNGAIGSLRVRHWRAGVVFRASLILAGLVLAGGANIVPALQPPVQEGSLLKMTNGNVRLDYDLSTGRANFYWKNTLKIREFYAGVGLDAYLTGNVYPTRSWSAAENQVVITHTGPGLPWMRQIFILDQADSFLTRVEVHGSGLKSRWMGPVVMDRVSGVEIGSYGDVRGLAVPFDNDAYVTYNSHSINNTGMSYEVSAFYDNVSRNGLVVGSVTHDQWKTGIYFQGANNRLNVLNVFGGVTSSDTRDVMVHGEIVGDPITSPTVFVGFGSDWRDTMEAYADANATQVPKMPWTGYVPFGWNSWYAYGPQVSYSNAMAAARHLRDHLQPAGFQNAGTAYINLDSYWDNLTDAQLAQFVTSCHKDGQRAGIYLAPFVYWGTAQQGSNYTMTASNFKWSDAYLRTTNGNPQSFAGGLALDPTHPGTRAMIGYYLSYFKSRGFDYLKLDFLSHGAMEGVHWDASITTGIQAYNQGMRFIVEKCDGQMFLNESIAPLFPYQYAHSRRISCDVGTGISATAYELNGVTYGWWIAGRLYEYSDPDMMKFSGATANENQSRLISAAISGTVYLNSDDLISSSGQKAARAHLTNTAINEVARAGRGFRPVEGNTGSAATDLFLRRDGAAWLVAVFNYSHISSASKKLDLSRLGISGDYIAVDLWSGASVPVTSGATWHVALGARQAKLFRLAAPVSMISTPLAFQVADGNLTLRWPVDHLGWRLQRSTKAEVRGLDSIWLDLEGSANSNTWTVPIDRGSGGDFFRLISP